MHMLSEHEITSFHSCEYLYYGIPDYATASSVTWLQTFSKNLLSLSSEQKWICTKTYIQFELHVNHNHKKITQITEEGFTSLGAAQSAS